MTGLLRMLAGILRDHIERVETPVVDKQPDLNERMTAVAAEAVAAFTPVADALRQVADDIASAAVARPCWCCGHPGGFTDPHHCIQHHNPGSQPHTYWSTQ